MTDNSFTVIPHTQLEDQKTKSLETQQTDKEPFNQKSWKIEKAKIKIKK